jgi:hypothetical protein
MHTIVKGVGDPTEDYNEMLPVWSHCRAMTTGERAVKKLDAVIDVINFSNILIPFSSSMSQTQYNFYKAEAELPGIVAQFSKMLVGGLLRKKPALTLPPSVPKDAKEWIDNQFNKDGGSLVSFLELALDEEVKTSRAWVYIDHPTVTSEMADKMTGEELLEFRPFPVLWEAEQIINCQVGKDMHGNEALIQVLVRGTTDVFEDGEFHAKIQETIWVHEIFEGSYRVQEYRMPVPVEDKSDSDKRVAVEAAGEYELHEIYDTFTINNKKLTFIPAWPLNGQIKITEPVLAALVDKEKALYNKVSRRNHLLYGASTYTPVVHSDMEETKFDEIVAAGLGSWLHIGVEDKISVLDTPTAALSDMETAISGAIEELARLGIRMMSPETAQSGVALEIRNAAQTAQLGILNTKISETMRSIIAFMLSWRYNMDVKASEVEFTLSADFNPLPLGADWLRLLTEWYEQGLLPRSIWLLSLKHNDMIPAAYDDEQGYQEMKGDKFMDMQGKKEEAASSKTDYTQKVSPTSKR